VFEVAIINGQVVDAEHFLYLGIETTAAAAHDHTEQGFGFYHANGNWFAVNVSLAAAVTATDTTIAVSAIKAQRLRAHCICDSAGLVTKILFYIDESLVATHTTNLPTTVGATFQPFINYMSRVVPAVTGNKDIAIDRFFMGGIRRYFHE